MRRHRTPDYVRLMNSRAWRRLRRTYLSQHPLCEDCLLVDRTTPAREVHHIRPIESEAGRPEMMKTLALDPANLRALCATCHQEAHRLLASSSKAVAKERAKDALDSFVSYYLSDPSPIK